MFIDNNQRSAFQKELSKNIESIIISFIAQIIDYQYFRKKILKLILCSGNHVEGLYIFCSTMYYFYFIKTIKLCRP